MNDEPARRAEEAPTAPIMRGMDQTNPRIARRPQASRMLKRILAHPVVTLFVAPFIVGLAVELAKSLFCG